jgi:hypothetical protein
VLLCVCDALHLHSGPLSAIRGATPPSRNGFFLMARATDERGRTQPLEQQNRGGYRVNFASPVPVTIKALAMVGGR